MPGILTSIASGMSQSVTHILARKGYMHNLMMCFKIQSRNHYRTVTFATGVTEYSILEASARGYAAIRPLSAPLS